MKEFIHNFKYNLLIVLRNKNFTLNVIIFPILLGMLFKFAFANLYSARLVETINVAVVEQTIDNQFHEIIEDIKTDDDKILFSPKYVTKSEALDLLKNKEVTAIIETEDMSLTTSSSGLDTTICKNFVKSYRNNQQIIENVMKASPEKLDVVIEKMSSDINCNTAVPLTKNELDPALNYFYNLIAMAAMLGTTTGLYVVVDNQANLSPIAAKRSCSSTNKLITLTATLCSRHLVMAVCISIIIAFLNLVLKIPFGSNLGKIYIVGIVGSILGTSLGFFMGAIGKMSFEIKYSLSLLVAVGGSFLSGLMLISVKTFINNNIPIVNKINPVAIISDTIYSLQIYPDYDLFYKNIVTMIVLIVVFTIGGFLLTRRNTYASLSSISKNK